MAQYVSEYKQCTAVKKNIKSYYRMLDVFFLNQNRNISIMKLSSSFFFFFKFSSKYKLFITKKKSLFMLKIFPWVNFSTRHNIFKSLFLVLQNVLSLTPSQASPGF